MRDDSNKRSRKVLVLVYWKGETPTWVPKMEDPGAVAEKTI